MDIKWTESHRNTVLSIGGEAFIEAIRLYGPSAVAEFLVKLSPKQDWVLNDLLAMVPTMAMFMRFNKKLVPFDCDPIALEKCLKRNPDYMRTQGIL